jgi:hypothetical protein
MKEQSVGYLCKFVVSIASSKFCYCGYNMADRGQMIAASTAEGRTQRVLAPYVGAPNFLIYKQGAPKFLSTCRTHRICISVYRTHRICISVDRTHIPCISTHDTAVPRHLSSCLPHGGTVLYFFFTFQNRSSMQTVPDCTCSLYLTSQ